MRCVRTVWFTTDDCVEISTSYAARSSFPDPLRLSDMFSIASNWCPRRRNKKLQVGHETSGGNAQQLRETIDLIHIC